MRVVLLVLALLVVLAAPAAAQDPVAPTEVTGGPVAGEEGPMAADAMAILTTYGLDDTAFDEQREAWTTWWRSVYADAEPAAV